MKKIKTLMLFAVLSAAISIPTTGQQTNAAPGIVPSAAAATNAAAPEATPPAAQSGNSQSIPQPPASDVAAPSGSQTANAAMAAQPATEPQGAEGVTSATNTTSLNGTNGLHLNFRGASLDQVLNYLSEAAGFIIVLDAQPRGRIDVFSNSPVTKEEAVNLLNQALKKNGYAAIRNGRTLTIVPRDEAKIHDIPVYVGSDPEGIPRTDEIVTQIIPVRFVEVTQLVKDLQPLVSTQTTMTANESGNEIVITDTQANIHKVAEIIKAIDAGAEDVTVVRVFKLNYADPTEMSDLLVNLFPDDTRSGGSSSPVQFGGFGGFRRFFGGGGGFGGGGPGGGGGNNGSNNQNQRIKKRARVIAVPDPRTSSVVVSCAKDLMDQIDGVVAELDSNPAKKKSVKVFKLNNADPQQTMQVMQDIFQASGTQNSRNSANQNSALGQRSTQQSTSTGNNNNNMGQGTRRNSGSFGGP
jgi:general secretion pathway protein D